MTTLLIVLASITAYLAIGVHYARSQAVPLYQRYMADQPEYVYESTRTLLRKHARESVGASMSWRVVAWPWAMLFDQIRGPVARHFTAPIDDRRTAAARLRTEVDQYDALIRGCADPTDRELMRAGQEALRQRAKDLDL